MNGARRLLELAAGRWARAGLVAVVGSWGTLAFAGVLEPFYPIKDWLAWTLLTLLGWVFVFNLACVCFGHFLLRRMLRLRELPLLETCVHSMVVGVVAFVLLMYAGGALALFGPVFALLLPAGMLAVGASDAGTLWLRLRDEFRRPKSSSWFSPIVSGFGVVCAGLLYLGVMTPDALNYDAAWCHAVVPQEYARMGRLVAFPGNYNMGAPHLHGLIHTWGFSLPGLDMPRRWMLLLHTEFALFLWTLAAVHAGVLRLLGEQRLRGAWTAMFLFPGIAVYDFNMGGAADHVAAFFAAPMLLALFELCRTFSPGSAALFAIAGAGCSLTKYQAIYLLVPMGLVFAAALASHALRRFRQSPDAARAELVPTRDLLRAPLIVLGVACLVVSPHFIKNAVFYGNPLYPFAQEVFRSSWPVVPDGPMLMRYIFTDDAWRPKGTFFEKAKNALGLVKTFSWEAHYTFTRNVPSFGSLFTLLLPALVAIRRPGRALVAAFIGCSAIFIWGMTYLVDRNLQLILPVLASVTGAVIVGCYRLGWLARLGLFPLVALQIIWGGDAWFYSAHERIESSINLIRSGYEGNAARRFDGYRSVYRSIARMLPHDARVLLHGTHLSLGIDREIIQDWAAFQGYVSYAGLRTPRELYDYLRERGITHLVYYPRERTAPSKQEELLFYAFVERHAEQVGSAGGYRVLAMPSTPPPPEEPYRVLVLGLNGYEDGIYPIQKLGTNEQLPPRVRSYARPDERAPDPASALATVDAVFVGARTRLADDTTARLRAAFTPAVEFSGQFALYLAKK